MSSDTAIGVFLSASRLASWVLDEEPRARKGGIQSMCRNPRPAKAPLSSTLALRDAGFRRICGQIARANHKDNKQHFTLKDRR
jgi:hypothetical protein